jgi:hypothetical protein
MNSRNPLSCAEFEALIPDLIDRSLSTGNRELIDAHRLDCDACDALAADLISIRQQAARLPALTPSRDLWAGIEDRIQAEVVEFPRTPLPGEVVAVVPGASPSRLPAHNSKLRASWFLVAAASLLVAATATITWSIASRANEAATFTADSLAAATGGALARPVADVAMAESYDREISDLRRIVDQNRADMDSVTIAVLERNLRVIDDAIAESKLALASSPESAFLLARLNDAYASKLRTLRAAVTPRRM